LEKSIFFGIFDFLGKKIIFRGTFYGKSY
jgi:hypothetical protein